MNFSTLISHAHLTKPLINEILNVKTFNST